MHDLQIGDSAYTDVAGTKYHGKIVGIHAEGGKITLYDLEVPEYGVFQVKPDEIVKETKNE